MAWTVSGSATSLAAMASRQAVAPPAVSDATGTSAPVPTHVRSSSSMNRQLPSERSTIR